MRRFARLFAASIVVILGLALVSAAAFNPQTGRVSLPTAQDEPQDEPPRKAIPPFDPKSGLGKHAGIPQALRYNAFNSEFGKRGNHEVTVSMSGPGYYSVHWRDGKIEEGAGRYSRTKTVKGGFPLALIAVNGAGRTVTCSITIDGVEKDTQTANAEEPIIFCEA